MSIQLQHTLGPVTALEFCSIGSNTLLLVGDGVYLKAFEITSCQLLFQCKAFDAQIIHGITVRADVSHQHDLQVVIWGGACLNYLRVRDLERLLNQGEGDIVDNATVAPDWILDVAIASNDLQSFAAVTARNTLCLVRSGEGSKAVSIQNLKSALQSILYSAHVIWESPERLLVAAGTVFGDVVVWTCLAGEDSFNEVQLLHFFKGHEGSVFGVNISPPIIDHIGRASRLVASCSDDRTIRVWSIVEISTVAQRDSGLASGEASLHGDTGFRDAGTIASSAKSDARCVAVVMGHASRIWRVIFSIKSSITSNSPEILVYSFGEDTTIQKWQLDFGNPQLPGPLKSGHLTADFSARLIQKHIFAFHGGKNIWSAALYKRTEGKELLATGGADGKIALITTSSDTTTKPRDLKALAEADNSSVAAYRMADASCHEQIWDLPAILHSLQSVKIPRLSVDSTADEKPSKEGDRELPPSAVSTASVKGKDTFADALNRYAFVSEEAFLLATAFGRVLLGRINDGVTWSEIPQPEGDKYALRSYAVMKGFPDLGLVFMAGSKGHIYMYQASAGLIEVGMVGSKVADMFGVVDYSKGTFELLVTTVPATSVSLLCFAAPLVEKHPFPNHSTLQVPHGFVVTSAGKSGNLLILGSRSGSLAVYNAAYNDRAIGLWESKDFGSIDAVTSVISLENGDNDCNKGQFLTTCRNGQYSIYKWVLTAGENVSITATLYPVHQGSPPFGPIIEAGWFAQSNLHLCGFRGKDFIVWNDTQQFEVKSVRCGGAHRSYAYCHPQLGETSHFVYTKASKLHLYSQRGPSHQIVRKGGHGREIKACAVSKDGQLIATGAEDTMIRIWRFEEDGENPGERLDCIGVLENHVTGIQRLRWHESKYLFSSGGNEEFFIWAIEDLPGFGIGVVREASCPTQSQGGDLRIMDFDVMTYPGSSSVEANLLITLAYSDSSIRFYSYTKSAGFKLLASATYASSCLMQLSYLLVTDGVLFFVTAATDGWSVLWRFKIPIRSALNAAPLPSVEPTIISVCQIHQSSIKSMDWTLFGSGNHILVATGGDDNALGILIYQRDSLGASNVLSSCTILRSAHAAAITGLCILPDHRRGDGGYEFRLVSSSNDQRVKEWRVRVDIVGGLESAEGCRVVISKVGDAFTAVADVGDLTVLHGREHDTDAKVLVVGAGMEVLEVSRAAR